MAHFDRILTADSLKRKLCCYKEIKVLKLSVDTGFETPWKDSPNGIVYFKFWRRYMKKFKTPNTIENAVGKSFIGFFGGVFVTYILFIFFYLGLGFSSRVTTYICVVVGVVLSLGLAFSENIRCYFFLVLPVLFLQQGREGLLAFILFLAITGPAKTTMNNMNILTLSMNCRQEIVGKTLIQILEMGNTPLKSIKETIQKLTKTSQEVSERVKSSFISIKRPIFGVLNAIMKTTYWLRSTVNLCNKKVGSPFQRCMSTFEDSIMDCKARLGVLDFLCHIVHTVKSLCYSVKNLDFLCGSTEFVSDKLTRIVKTRIKEFSLKMRNLFYVSIEFGHSSGFHVFAFNSSANPKHMDLQRLNATMENIEIAYIFFIFFLTFFFIYVCLKVYYYKYKYLSSDQYDNLYISKYIIELDLRRALMNRETVLPLEPREEKIFAKPTSLRLLREEKIRMTKSICLLILTTIKIITFMMLDYSLFWTLSIIYNAGYNEFQRVEKPEIILHVEGEGVVADFFRNLGKTFQISEDPEEPLNSLTCLPDPESPNTKSYMQIGFFLTLCWVFTLTEAYGLRLRNVVMSHYYPDRARERAVWLYNHILFSRGSFVKYARKQLKRKFQTDKKGRSRKVALGHGLFLMISRLPILGHFLLKHKHNVCLSCGTFETKEEPLKRCKTPKCFGKYCIDCFVSLQNLCMVCQHPINSEDFSYMDDEGDSSEEEMYVRSHHGLISPSKKKDKFTPLKAKAGRERNLEAIRKKDYARLSDLYSHKMDIRQRLKSAILRRIRSLVIKNKQKESRSKRNVNKRLKSKLQDFVRKLSGKKSLEPIAKQKVLDELYKMKQEKLERAEPESSSKREKENFSSITGFSSLKTQKPFSLPQSKADYEKLKSEVIEKIKFLKGQKNTKGKTLSCLPESEEKSANSDSGKSSGKVADVESSGQDASEGRITGSTAEKSQEFGVPSSLSKFWESKCARNGFMASESEANFLDCWTLNSESQVSSFPPEIWWDRSGSDERWRNEKNISDASFEVNKFVYYFVKKENNFDFFVKDVLEAGGNVDVNFRTFIDDEHEQSEEEDFVL